MRPWRSGSSSGRRPSSVFNTNWTGSGRPTGGFRSAWEVRGHFSRNALPISLSSACEWCGMKEVVLVLMACPDFGTSRAGEFSTKVLIGPA